MRGRCRATNLCAYCARLAAVETTELLWVDALEQGSPTLWALVTTNDPVWDGEKWRRSMRQLLKACKRRWPEFEYAALIEFTTGYGHRAGGKRRPHANLFVRGVPVEDAAELQHVIASVWVPRMVEGWNRSESYAAKAFDQQRVYAVVEDKGGMRGLTRYVALHFLKESQSPDRGWSGQRFRASRGYFTTTRAELRERARASLRRKRIERKAQLIAFDRICREGEFDEDWGVDPAWDENGDPVLDRWVSPATLEVESMLVADELVAQSSGVTWELVRELRRVGIDGTSTVTGFGVVRCRPPTPSGLPAGVGGRQRRPDLLEVALRGGERDGREVPGRQGGDERDSAEAAQAAPGRSVRALRKRPAPDAAPRELRAVGQGGSRGRETPVSTLPLPGARVEPSATGQPDPRVESAGTT